MTKTLILILILIPLLSGCSVISWPRGKTVEPIIIETVAESRIPLNLRDPASITPRTVKWLVVTPENVNDVWEQLAKDGQHTVLFAVTADGYESMSLNLLELRQFIMQQRSIIIKYKEYYEGESE